MKIQPWALAIIHKEIADQKIDESIMMRYVEWINQQSPSLSAIMEFDCSNGREQTVRWYERQIHSALRGAGDRYASKLAPFESD